MYNRFFRLCDSNHRKQCEEAANMSMQVNLTLLSFSIEFEIEKLADINRIMKKGVMTTPHWRLMASKSSKAEQE